MRPSVAFGRTVAVLRTAAGIKRRQLADVAAISYAYLSEIENGAKEPSLDALRRIAVALHVRPSYLLGLAEQMEEGKSII